MYQLQGKVRRKGHERPEKAHMKQEEGHKPKTVGF